MTDYKRSLKDILGIPVYVGDTILGISGINRTVEVISYINHDSVSTENGGTFFVGNFIKIDDIINNNKEYFV